MANEYTIRNTRGTLLTTITQGTKDDSTTSLVLEGRGMLEYGLDRDQNLVFLLENFSDGSPPFNPLDGQLWWRTGRELFVWDTQAGSPAGTGLWDPIQPPPQAQLFVIEAGAGLTGGGFPTLSPLETTLNVGAGTGIRVGSPVNKVSTKDSEIVHDNLSGFVANEHIDHSAILLAGAGLFGSPSDLTASLTINVGAGDGIAITDNRVGVDNTVVRTLGSPIQTVAGIKTWTVRLFGDGVTIGTIPSFSFDGDTDTGIYHSGANQLTFVTNATDRINLDSDGVLSVATPSYHLLVTEDDDIPNKRYVDDTIGTGFAPTSNTFVGIDSISGLDGTQTYLVTAYGVLPNKGTQVQNLNAIVVRDGTTLGGGSAMAIIAGGGGSIDWFDGGGPTHSNIIVPLGSFGSPIGSITSINCAVNNDAFGLWGSTLLQAIQLTNN